MCERVCGEAADLCVLSRQSERKPKGSGAVFTFSCFLLDLCLSMVCLHLFVEYMSVEDAARKFHRGKAACWDVLLLCTVGCNYLK